MMSGDMFTAPELSAADMTASCDSAVEFRGGYDGEISLQPVLRFAHLVGILMCSSEVGGVGCAGQLK